MKKRYSLTFRVGECGSLTGSIAVGSSDPYVLTHTVRQSKCGLIHLCGGCHQVGPTDGIVVHWGASIKLWIPPLHSNSDIVRTIVLDTVAWSLRRRRLT